MDLVKSPAAQGVAGRKLSPQQSPEWMREAEVALYTGIGASRLAKCRMEPGAGPKFRRVGRSIVYHRDDVDEWLRSFELITSTQDGRE